MTPPNLKRNFVYNVTYEILILLIPLITSPYVSRVLGADNLGIYSYTIATTHLFAIFAFLGIGNHGSRSIARVRDDRALRSQTFWSIYTIQLTCTLVVMLVYCLYAAFFTDSAVYAWVCMPLLFATGIDVNWFFFGLERFKLTVTRNAIIKIAVVIMIFVLIHDANDVWLYILLTASSTLASNIILLPFLVKEVDFIRPTFSLVCSHIAPILKLFLPIIAVNVYTYVDKVLLGVLAGMEQTGYFENALKFPALSLSTITALGTIMLPRISYLIAKDKNDQARQYLSKSMWFAMMLSMALMFGLMGISIEIAPVFFGTQFTPSGPIIMILAVEIPFIAWANVIRTQYLIPALKDRIYISSVITGAVVNLILNLILIPYWGAIGAAFSTVIAEASVSFYQSIKVRLSLPIKEWLTDNAIYAVFGFIMFCCVRVIGSIMGSTVIGSLTQILSGMAIYTALCVGYFCVTKNSYAMEVFSSLLSSIKKRDNSNIVNKFK